ncbi:S1C family serine protease [Pyxidicoccus sp. MSG2]|uniref:S1C family serine protease n=1 Tax=Pyxidicoccus sp. MSG2 TaxID=2996790 RepID=UPI002270CABD|nr:trypsin-like peptidase domain-containing protein [Pyxidicoccus sp. MSG2]MCY1020153.1 trypsin-like peptidase domain-containing protein [Pyxidicoccus sp. MSG2]
MAKMSDSVEVRCLRCGAPDAGERARCVCGASLLMDVVLKGAMVDERQRFGLARALALLGPPAPSFSEARVALAIPGNRVVRGVSSAFAQKLLAVLSAHGADAYLQPSELPEAAAPRRSSRAALAAALGVLVLGGVAFGAWATRSPRLRQLSGWEPGTSAQEAVKAPEEGTLSTQDIARLASPGTVSLRCEGKTGSGFFVDAELVLTNEHVVCPAGKMMTVMLPDGRQLLGETLKTDVDLDLATVRVVGAKAAPLRVGDVTRLEPGDRLVFIGSPKGLDFTVHEGKVGFVGREYLGNGYVQFNASVNPGNSGGPLLDGRGEVVGVVSMKVNDADGMGLALPIPYASKLITVPTTPESTARWDALLARVSRDEQREIQRYQQETAEPVLLSVRRVEQLGLVALLIERFDAPPRRVVRRMELESEGQKCSLTVDFEYWRPVRDTMSAAEDSRRLRWFAARGLSEGIHVGAARLPVEDCSLTGAGNASLKLEGAGAQAERFDVPMKDFHASREDWKRNKGGIQIWQQSLWQRREEADRSRQEADEWRNNFSRARSRIATLEEEKRKLLAAEAAGGPSTKRRWEVEVELKLAQGQLADLERYATEKRVPAAWRQ